MQSCLRPRVRERPHVDGSCLEVVTSYQPWKSYCCVCHSNPSSPISLGLLIDTRFIQMAREAEGESLICCIFTVLTMFQVFSRLFKSSLVPIPLPSCQQWGTAPCFQRSKMRWCQWPYLSFPDAVFCRWMMAGWPDGLGLQRRMHHSLRMKPRDFRATAFSTVVCITWKNDIQRLSIDLRKLETGTRKKPG